MRPLFLTASVAALAVTGGLLAGCGDDRAETTVSTDAAATAPPEPDAIHRASARAQDGTPQADNIDAVPDGAVMTGPDPVADPVDISLELGGEAVPFETWHHLLMPGETLEISANGPVELRVDGDREGDAATTHSWTAPSTPGVHDFRIEGDDGVEHRISVFVLQPLNGQEVLEGYRIGEYPQNAPRGLIRLTQGDMDTPVSPSFTIGQFICKQQPGHWPKYLLVSGSLLLRLEAVLSELRSDDLTEADTFFVMSGYRTPFYNTAIRSARLSRHMYGDAADIYPDVEGNDSVMDDLNGDGRITRADAEFLYDYAEDLFASRADIPDGGIGAYDANAVHGPFVHIDGRGHRARWGRTGS